MKPTQWVGAGFILAAMVFVVTFAMNYIGNADTPSHSAPAPTVAPLDLTFVEAMLSPSGSRLVPPRRMDCEVKSPNHYDFWFQNDNERTVDVGLHYKSCKCAGADLYVLPREGQQQLAHRVAGALVLAAGRPLDLGNLTAVARALGDLDKSLRPVPLGDEGERASLAAGAVGWVRLHWKGDHLGPQNLRAEIWVDKKDGGSVQRLEVQARFFAPVSVSQGGELNMGHMKVEDLPRTASLLCWSSTRLDFRVQGQVESTRERRTSDPVVVGRPEPLSPEDCARLEQSRGEGQVLSGYRIPVTLLPVSQDGSTPFSLGRFRQEMILSSPDEGIEPLQVSVTGTVEGAVRVETEEGVLRFGSFNRSQGKRQSLTLGADGPGLELDVDRERTPDYLTVHLDKPRVALGHQTWRLLVQVLPNRVSGSFPRQDDPAYRDCAVYLKTREKTPRSIRIPVVGTANDG